MNKYILSAKQKKAISFTSFQFQFIGGIRSGKTIAGAHFMVDDIIVRPHIKKIIFSNTTGQLSKSTLHEFMNVLAAYGLMEGAAYVKNKNPKKFFGYDSMYDDHSGIWSFKNGAQILVYSLDQPIRGTEFGTAWGDEVQDAKKERIDLVLGRMSEDNPKTLYTLTPPRNNPEINEWVFDGDIPKVIATTYDNEDNLPKGYIKMLYDTFDPLTFDREVMANEAKSVENRFAYEFTDHHINAHADYEEGMPVYLSFDFNVNPGTCIAWQEGTYEDGKPWIHYFDEIVVQDADVYKMCDRVMSKFPNDYLKVTGDRTALKKEFAQRTNAVNTWTIIKKELGLTDAQLQLVTNPRTENVKMLCNSLLAKHNEIFFHPRMKNTIRDLRFVTVDGDGKINKKNRKDVLQQADLLDCWKYSCWTFHRKFVIRYRNVA